MFNLKKVIPDQSDWTIRWDKVCSEFPELSALRGCPQSDRYHGEGDVWEHTKMVCESLVALSEWRSLRPDDRENLFLAALLHDIGKPGTTKDDDGVITARKHAQRGAILARNYLWERDVPLTRRELIVQLVLFHQAPLHLMRMNNAEKLVLRISCSVRCDHLALLARADCLGRIAMDREKIFDGLDMFVEYCSDLNCLNSAFPFPSEHTRFKYFSEENRSPVVDVFNDTSFEVTLLSGLPGAGKDYWIRYNSCGLPVISLDEIRKELKIDPSESQGRVVNHARDLAKIFLRKKEPFIWNATNVTREMRSRCISLFSAYNARIRVVYIESSFKNIYLQNESRDAVVPKRVIDKLRMKWELPEIVESHQLEFFENKKMS
ncbi:AAA family ATPase [Desulfomicrobium baculatum]|uniref:Metal dependent phosphohydrolase n=1 Tax=Desulfomicrobium baculatum (strain DSM 4028 / VKM B-1378 / X) TaxID=525897 RepID=C7LRX7_DESBD|nr:AAA family ATPase [Desulfomicrobium baculatum]ACU89360.1 metal dependent phosphohydrolase [Desulfomicrobium baculatum DSM 4028]